MKYLLVLFVVTGLTFNVQTVMAGETHYKEHANTSPTVNPTQTTPKAVEVGNKICPVSGNKVDDGKMGETVKYEYNGKIYNLCCPMCIKDFKKNPEKYSKIAEIEAAKTKNTWKQFPEKKHR